MHRSFMELEGKWLNLQVNDFTPRFFYLEGVLMGKFMSKNYTFCPINHPTRKMTLLF